MALKTLRNMTPRKMEKGMTGGGVDSAGLRRANSDFVQHDTYVNRSQIGRAAALHTSTRVLVLRIASAAVKVEEPYVSSLFRIPWVRM